MWYSALRATELCPLNVGDVLDANGDVKLYVITRADTAKFGKGRTIRLGQPVRHAVQAPNDRSGEFLYVREDDQTLREEGTHVP